MVSAKSVGDPVTNHPKPFDAAIAELVKIETETEDDKLLQRLRICPDPSTTHF